MLRQGLKDRSKVPLVLVLVEFLFVHLLRFFHEVFLGVERCRVSTVDPLVMVALQNPGLGVVLPHDVEDLNSPGFGISLLDWVELLDPPVKIPGHHVGTGQVDLFIPVALKVVDPGVLQETTDDRVHLDVVVQLQQVVTQAGDPPDDQLDLDPVGRRIVQAGDDLLVGQGIHFHPNQGRTTILGHGNLFIDLLVDEFPNPVWGDAELVEVRRPGEPGQHVEEISHVDPQFVVTGE